MCRLCGVCVVVACLMRPGIRGVRIVVPVMSLIRFVFDVVVGLCFWCFIFFLLLFFVGLLA